MIDQDEYVIAINQKHSFKMTPDLYCRQFTQVNIVCEFFVALKVPKIADMTRRHHYHYKTKKNLASLMISYPKNRLDFFFLCYRCFFFVFFDNLSARN